MVPSKGPPSAELEGLGSVEGAREGGESPQEKYSPRTRDKERRSEQVGTGVKCSLPFRWNAPLTIEHCKYRMSWKIWPSMCSCGTTVPPGRSFSFCGADVLCRINSWFERVFSVCYIICQLVRKIDRIVLLTLSAVIFFFCIFFYS